MKRANTAIYILAFCLFAAAVGWLGYAGFSANSVYFLNVSEARAMPPDKLGQARLFGLVSAQSLNKVPGQLRFDLVDKDDARHSIPVSYTGLVPDTFKAGAEVIVEGVMNGMGQFLADTLMTKCPSKYQKENRER